MNTDRDLHEHAGRRERGGRLVWIGAGVAILALLIVLGPAPARDAQAPGTGTRLLEQSAPAVPQHTASLSGQIDWNAKEASPDPSPLSVAAYER